MEEHARDGSVGRAALRADMDEKTARKYLKVRKMPSELVTARSWRTRPDPFEANWSDVVKLLEDAPDLEAAYAARPDRFVNKPPVPPAVPAAAWINPPKDAHEPCPIYTN